MKKIEAERLILRQISMDDLDQIYENWASDKITNEYLTFKCHESKAETEKMINYWLSKYDKGGYEWCIELKENHQVIGIISGDKSYKYKCIEIGYSIGSKYFNKGYITESLKAIIDYLFKECDFEIIEAIIPSNNIASIKVAEKSGMRKETTLKERYRNKITNEINDLYVYSIFKKDYK